MDSLDKERLSLLEQVSDLLENPLVLLSIIWLGLVLYEFIYGQNNIVELFIYIIWGIFIFSFLLELILAPKKVKYLKNNVLTILSLFLPALRFFRIFRFLRILRASRILRSLNLVKIFASFNRGMRTFRSIVDGRGIGFVIILSLFVILLGAAGINNFEGGVGDGGISNYGDALWFTAMLMTTLGSEYWPKTVEGRILTFVIALYSFGVFGFIAGTIASLILGKTVKDNNK